MQSVDLLDNEDLTSISRSIDLQGGAFMVDLTFNGEFRNIPGFEDTPSQFPLFAAVTRETPPEFGASFVFDPDVGAWVTDGGATFLVVNSVPEPGTTVGLLAIAGLGLGIKKKK